MTLAPDDKTLTRTAPDEDEAAEDIFARRFRDKLVALARRLGVPADDCEDVANETILAAISQFRRGLFRGDSSVGTWLNTILRGKAADFWRARSKEGLAVTLDECGEALSGQAESAVVQVHSDPIARLMVREVLDRMPAKHRRVLLLNQRDGYTTEEIARLLDWRAGTVGRVLAEAKAMFRDFILGGEESGGGMRQGG